MRLYVPTFSLLLLAITYRFCYSGTLFIYVWWLIFDNFVHEHYAWSGDVVSAG